MSLNSVLKRNARLALRGNWGKAIGIFVVLVAVSGLLGVLQNVSTQLFVTNVYSPNPTMELLPITQDQIIRETIIVSVFSLLALLLVSPLSLGMVRWHNELVYGRKPGFSDLFYYFDSPGRYLRALWLEINLMVRLFLWALLFLAVPSGLMAGAIYLINGARGSGNSGMYAAGTVGVLFAVLLLLLAVVLYYIFSMRYFLSPYLIAGDEELRVGRSIRLSVKDSKGYRASLLGFQLSFVWWILLSAVLFAGISYITPFYLSSLILILGLGLGCAIFGVLFYLHPYYNTSCAMYARFIVEKSGQQAPPPDITQEFRLEESGDSPEPLGEQQPSPPEQEPGGSDISTADGDPL